jgi:hypothetical protein
LHVARFKYQSNCAQKLSTCFAREKHPTRQKRKMGGERVRCTANKLARSAAFSTSYARPSLTSLNLLLHAAVTQQYIFRQLVDEASNTYTYLLADAKTKEAVLIDPVLEQVRLADRLASITCVHSEMLYSWLQAICVLCLTWAKALVVFMQALHRHITTAAHRQAAAASSVHEAG